MKELIPINYENQRIITTSIIAEEYGTTEKVISNNFNRNKDKYQEGKHYFILQGNELKEFLHSSNLGVQNSSKVRSLYLWTEKGALLHAKSLNTDKAWQVYEYLVDNYFNKNNGQALNTSELSPELQMFNQMFKAIANQEIEQKKIKADIQDAKNQLQGIRDIVALTPNAWRKDTASLISKIAMKLGGFDHIKDVRDESYKILNETYKVDIKRRLVNKQKNMALEGCSKSKISKVNYLDVIADDEKLINGYLNIISKMAIKYGVDMN